MIPDYVATHVMVDGKLTPVIDWVCYSQSLKTAIRQSHPDVIDVLLHVDVSLNDFNKLRFDPLLEAALCRRNNVIEKLISRGADPNIKYLFVDNAYINCVETHRHDTLIVLMDLVPPNPANKEIMIERACRQENLTALKEMGKRNLFDDMRPFLKSFITSNTCKGDTGDFLKEVYDREYFNARLQNARKSVLSRPRFPKR